MMDYVIEIYKQLNPEKEVPEVCLLAFIILELTTYVFLINQNIMILGNENKKRSNCISAQSISK